jgi:DNA-binding transcriptional LysR family regulator
VNVDLEERLSDEIVAAVADGKADIGIVAGTEDITGLEVFPFRTDRFVLVTSPEHRLASSTKLAFADALDSDFVGTDRASSLQRFLSEKAERTGRRMKLRVQLRSFDGVCRMVAANVGIGIVPESSAIRSKQHMKLHVIELNEEWALRNLMICVRSLKDLPIYAQDLVKQLMAPEASTR